MVVIGPDTKFLPPATALGRCLVSSSGDSDLITACRVLPRKLHVFRKRGPPTVYEFDSDLEAITISQEKTEGEKKRRIVLVATSDGGLWKVPVYKDKKQEKKRPREDGDIEEKARKKRPAAGSGALGTICFSSDDGVAYAVPPKPQWRLGMVAGVRQLCRTEDHEESAILASSVTGQVMHISWAGGGGLQQTLLGPFGQLICALPSNGEECLATITGDRSSGTLCGDSKGELRFINLSKARRSACEAGITPGGGLGEACVCVSAVRRQDGVMCGILGVGASGTVVLSLPSQHRYRLPYQIVEASVVGEDLLFITTDRDLMAAKLTCTGEDGVLAAVARLETRPLGVSGVVAMAEPGETMCSAIMTSQGELLDILPQWNGLDGAIPEEEAVGVVDPSAIESRVKQLVGQVGQLSATQAKLATLDRAKSAMLAQANAVLHRASRLHATCRVLPQYHPLRYDNPCVLSIEVPDNELGSEWYLIITMARGAHHSPQPVDAGVTITLPIHSLALTSRGSLRGECVVPSRCLPSVAHSASTLEVRIMLGCRLKGGEESLATASLGEFTLDVLDFIAAPVTRKKCDNRGSQYKTRVTMGQQQAPHSLASLLQLANRLPEKTLADPTRMRLVLHPGTEVQLHMQEIEMRSSGLEVETTCFEIEIEIYGELDPIMTTRIYSAIMVRIDKAPGVLRRDVLPGTDSSKSAATNHALDKKMISTIESVLPSAAGLSPETRLAVQKALAFVPDRFVELRRGA